MAPCSSVSASSPWPSPPGSRTWAQYRSTTSSTTFWPRRVGGTTGPSRSIRASTGALACIRSSPHGCSTLRAVPPSRSRGPPTWSLEPCWRRPAPCGPVRSRGASPGGSWPYASCSGRAESTSRRSPASTRCTACCSSWARWQPMSFFAPESRLFADWQWQALQSAPCGSQNSCRSARSSAEWVWPSGRPLS